MYSLGKSISKLHVLLMFLFSREWEDYPCVAIFSLVYYFTMAARVWFVLLAVAWNIYFRQLGKPAQDQRKGRRLAYFHAIAWILPMFMVVASVFARRVSGEAVGLVTGYEHRVGHDIDCQNSH